MRENHSTLVDDPAPMLPAMSMVPSPDLVRRIAWWMTITFFLLPFLLIFVPWTQTVRGKGRVVADSPLERQQSLRAPLDGLIVNYFGHREGSLVRKGDPVFKMADNDPKLVERIELQVGDLKRKVEYSEQKVVSFQDQMDLLRFALDSALAAAEAGVETAKNKVSAAERTVEAAKATAAAARQIHERVGQLVVEQLASQQEFELAERDRRKAEADEAKALADLAAAQNEVKSKFAEIEQKRREGEAKIEEARSKREQAASELATAQKEARDLDSKLAQLGTQLVVAPWDGVILRLLRAQDTDFVKKGDPVVTLVPDTDSPAVELWVDGNDIPLVSGKKELADKSGQTVHVRLQFEGWPAVQFAGWPSVAVGTFGGIVKLVDATDNGEGQFRVLIVPDPESPPWPGKEYLRQGVQTRGWVLLNQVSLGWEFWRKLNGFPPVVSKSGPEKSEKDDDILPKRGK